MPLKVSQEEVLTSYEQEVKKLRRLGKELRLRDSDIDEIIHESFNFLQEHNERQSDISTVKNSTKCRNILCSFTFILKLFILILLSLFLTCLVMTYHKPTYNLVVRNVQELIYPTMKCLRRLTLPVVRAFPSITVWYDEMCLVENPYFQATDLNCWACEEVRSVLDLSEIQNPRDFQPHSGFPYIVKSLPRVNRLEPARVLRKLFPRPSFIPNTVNMERFILIDEPNAPQYKLPFPEGYRVFIMQGSGERLLVLEPVEGCHINCTRVSVLLKPSDFLYYNSWFYRPKSNPVENSTSISISYIGSL
ncbi:hypothetical protein C0J52_26729 [Blattella germanica]|nr:hypothetical protein C0J52_26729 [Blattella germanica]